MKLIVMLLFTFGVFAKEKTKCQVIGKRLCCLESTKKSPFYLAQGNEGRKFSKFKPLKRKDKESYLPQDTLIHIPSAIFKSDTSDNFRYPFKVLSIPNKKMEKTAQGSVRAILKDQYKGIEGMVRVKKNDIGYIDKEFVKSVDGYTFFVSESAPAYKTPRGKFLKDFQFKLYEKDGGFGIRRCCPLTIAPKLREKNLSKCHDEYIFRLLDKQGQVVDAISTDNISCNFYKYLTPIPDEETKPLSQINSLLLDSAVTSKTFKEAGIENLEFFKHPENDFPLIKFPIDSSTLKGPYKTRHYRQDDDVNSDAFIQPITACTFLQVAKVFQQNCSGPGCEIQFGNVYHKKSWRPHRTHGSGECLDIRPFRNSTDDISTGGTFIGPSYDREKTRIFLELAIKSGATSVYFNDMNLVEHFKRRNVRKELMPYRKGDAWSFWERIEATNKPNHNDHMHICFKAKNPVVKQTCDRGL